jgi:hypothetical protein
MVARGGGISVARLGRFALRAAANWPGVLFAQSNDRFVALKVVLRLDGNGREEEQR